MSPLGYFVRYNYKIRYWQDLQRLTDNKPNFRNMIVLNGLIYCVRLKLYFSLIVQLKLISSNAFSISIRHNFTWINFLPCVCHIEVKTKSDKKVRRKFNL